MGETQPWGRLAPSRDANNLELALKRNNAADTYKSDRAEQVAHRQIFAEKPLTDRNHPADCQER